MPTLLSLYSPSRVKSIFLLLLTLFMLIKRKESFMGMRPMEPGKLRETIVSLGAAFIKLAQVLATRADFFDDRYLAELKALHDEIPPMSERDFGIVFERAFAGAEPFESFDTRPIASASIGQVHEALLKSGERVAVKLRRKDIEKRIEADIAILSFFNILFRPLFSHHTKNSIDSLISEFADMTRKEVDLSVELGNLKSFSKTYENSSIIFPRAYEKLCSCDALVMSFEEGIRFDDKEGLERLKLDFHSVMESLILFYTEQMLIKGYFHADPHPGNLLIRPDGRLVLLDFGMLKRLSNPTRVAIIEMVKSAHEEDFDLYISSCKRLGVIAYEAPQEKMTELAQRMFDIFNDDSLDAMTMQELAFGVMASMRDFPFKLPQEAIYILRASAIIEGLGTVYVENFNGIKDILPILQRNIPRALGADTGLFELAKNEFDSLPLRVKQLSNAIEKASEDELRVHISERQLEWLESRFEKKRKRERLALLSIMLSLFLLLLDADEYRVAATLIFTTGAFMMLL